MRNRPPFALHLSLIAVFLFCWFFWPADEETPSPLKSSKVEKARRPKANPPAEANTPLTAPAPQATSTKILTVGPASTPDGHPAPPKNAVPFKVIEDWVVAYGDILLGKPNEANFPASGFIEAPKVTLWDKGEIPFVIDPSLRNTDRVLRVLTYFSEHSNIRFIPYSDQKDFLVFLPFNSDICLSYLGKVGGGQPIFLGDRCDDTEITHELMHALGFIHEHSRADRDQYVQIDWKNIEEDKMDQFEITPESLNEPMKGRPFDYQSIMLYPERAFAKDRSKPTIKSLSAQKIEPSGRNLSPEDLERLRQLYR